MNRFGKIAVVAFVVAGFASTAMASYTRMHSLGEGGRYLKDETNVRFFPSLIAEFPDQFGLELGNAVSNFNQPFDPVLAELTGHIHLNTLYGVVLGIWASDYNHRNSGDIGAQIGASFAEKFAMPTNEFDPNGAGANRKYDLVLGRAFNWGSLGLNIAYGSSSYDRSPHWDEVSQFNADYNRAKDSFSYSELSLRFGGTMRLANRLAIDAALYYNSMGYAYKPDGISFPGTLDAGGAYGLIARANWLLSARWSIVPMLKFDMASASGTQTRDAGSADNLDPEFQTRHNADKMDFELGVGFVLTPMAGITVYVAPAITYTKESMKQQVDFDWNKDTWTQMNLPQIRSGIEFQLTDWMVLRSAFVKNVMDNTHEHADYIDAVGKMVVTTRHDLVPQIGNQAGQASYWYTVGFGLTFERFFLDFELDPAYFNRGPYLLSGAGGNMFLRASATYLF